LNRFLVERLRCLWSALTPHGWAGALLVALAWPLNWALPGLRTHLLFFPLWLGYALLVDALVLRRRGTSILTRSPKDFAILFACSAPATPGSRSAPTTGSARFGRSRSPRT
jgi:hypothetical protein